MADFNLGGNLGQSLNQFPISMGVDPNQPSPDQGLGLKVRPIDDLNQRYISAVKSKDLGLMKSVAGDAVGTDVAEKANESVKIMEDNRKLFNEKAVPMANQLQTSDGRVKLAEQYESIKDNPKLGSFLIQALLKNPNARLMIDGGIAKPFYEQGNDGRTYRVMRDELGDPLEATDAETKQPIGKDKLIKLQIGMPLTAERLKKQQENNIEAKNNEDKALAAYKGLASNSNMVGTVTMGLAKELQGKYGFSQQELADIIGFEGAKYGSSTSISDVSDKLTSLSNGKNVKFSDTDEKTLQGAGGVLGLGTISGKGGKVLVNGRDATKNELDQIQKHFSNIKEQSANYDVTQESAAGHKAFMRLPGDLQTQVLGLKRMQQEYHALENEIKTKHGSLPFLTPTSSFDLLTTPNRLEAQAETLIHNARTINNYEEWRNKKLDLMEGQLPVPGALQSSYLGSEPYKIQANEFKTKLINALQKPVTLDSETLPKSSLGNVMGEQQPMNINAPMSQARVPTTNASVKNTNAPVPPKPTAKTRRTAQEIINSTLKVLP